MGEVIDFPEAPVEPFQRKGLGYMYEPIGYHVQFRADFIKRRSEELHGVLTVETTLPGVAPHLHEATHNFSSLSSRTSVAKVLSERAPGIPWRDLLEQFCVGVMRRERQGEPFVEVGQRPDSVSEPDDLEILLPHNRITWLFGEEGAGKGTLAVAWMVGIATGQGFLHFRAQQRRVAYLDWEDDDDTMDWRIKAICRGLSIEPPKFLYRHFSAPLATQVHAVAQQFDALGIGAYVVDSAVLAGGVGNEHGGDAADTAHALVSALTTLGRTVLVIDHIAKAEAPGSNKPMRPYGSVMKRAWARQAWELRKDQEPGTTEFTVGLYHNKFNHGTLQPPLGIRISWDGREAVTFTRTDVKRSPALVATGSLTTRIERLLLGDPGLSLEEIAETLDARPDSVSRTLRRYMGEKFTSVKGGWACLHRDYA